MRQFYLVDDVGSTFYFDYRMSTLLVEVDGIGIKRSNTYLNFSGTYKLAKRENPQSQITGTLIFLKGYYGYTEFLRYLNKCSGSLRLFYKADNLKYIYVEVAELGKTELNYGVLQCQVVFDKLSMWLNKVNQIINVNEASGNKVFPFTYPFSYSSSYDGEITAVNNGCIKAPIRLEIIGKTNNPTVEIIKDGVVVSMMRLLISTNNDSDKIIVNAEATSQEMTKTINGVTTDIYQYQDFSCDNFLELDVGTYRIRYRPGVADKSLCKVQFLEMYEGN